MDASIDSEDIDVEDMSDAEWLAALTAEEDRLNQAIALHRCSMGSALWRPSQVDVSASLEEEQLVPDTSSS
eukprot:864282-Karenia_brevis.AAC.1